MKIKETQAPNPTNRPRGKAGQPSELLLKTTSHNPHEATQIQILVDTASPTLRPLAQKTPLRTQIRKEPRAQPGIALEHTPLKTLIVTLSPCQTHKQLGPRRGTEIRLPAFAK
ncbi:hypothetical protein C1H46_003045 [Malus baccata]|uniref:Uncharacterized protein n=1 Tax=Malus baccata TaxID=106549 RepID=A0A540NJX0_MALBA|nr:hypothetical protein C1H46_003045 [Malus baccata]